MKRRGVGGGQEEEEEADLEEKQDQQQEAELATIPSTSEAHLAEQKPT